MLRNQPTPLNSLTSSAGGHGEGDQRVYSSLLQQSLEFMCNGDSLLMKREADGRTPNLIYTKPVPRLARTVSRDARVNMQGRRESPMRGGRCMHKCTYIVRYCLVSGILRRYIL